MTTQNQTKPKRRRKIILIIISVILVVFVFPTVAVVLRGLYVAAATKGDAIGEYENPKKALLVIDAQNDTWNNKNYARNKESVMEQINTAIEWTDGNDILVIYVKMEIGNLLTQYPKDKIGTNTVQSLCV